MNSLEFAAREKVNQLAVLANFSSRAANANEPRARCAYTLPVVLLACLCLPVANRQPCLRFRDYAERLIENGSAKRFSAAFLFRAGEHREPSARARARSTILINPGKRTFHVVDARRTVGHESPQ